MKVETIIVAQDLQPPKDQKWTLRVFGIIRPPTFCASWETGEQSCKRGSSTQFHQRVAIGERGITRQVVHAITRIIFPRWSWSDALVCFFCSNSGVRVQEVATTVCATESVHTHSLVARTFFLHIARAHSAHLHACERTRLRQASV